MWGFSKTDNIDNLTIGKSYKLYYIDEKLSNNASSSLINIKKDSKAWEFIMYLENRPTIFVTVKNVDGNYKVVKFGGNASIFDSALKTFNKSSIDKTQERTVIQGENIYYLAGTNGSNEFIVPAIPQFQSNKASLDSNNTTSIKPSKAIEYIKNGLGSGITLK
jgi:hypothetical protein